MIHDSQFDYYAKKLATCSSDRTIKVFEVVGDKYRLSATLTGHEGPIWQIAWAHPKFGVLLASCSYDGSVLIHREAPQNTWSKVIKFFFLKFFSFAMKYKTKEKHNNKEFFKN